MAQRATAASCLSHLVLAISLESSPVTALVRDARLPPEQHPAYHHCQQRHRAKTHALPSLKSSESLISSPSPATSSNKQDPGHTLSQVTLPAHCLALRSRRSPSHGENLFSELDVVGRPELNATVAAGISPTSADPDRGPSLILHIHGHVSSSPLIRWSTLHRGSNTNKTLMGIPSRSRFLIIELRPIPTSWRRLSHGCMVLWNW